MHQKIHYLTTLFDMMVQEQRKLLECVDTDTFFDKIAQVELDLRKGLECQRVQQYIQAKDYYTNALDTIKIALHGDTTTRLLDNIQCQLYEKRAICELELQIWDLALSDANALLNFLGEESSAKAHIIQSKAFRRMGKMEDAKAALGKAVVVNPQDEALRAELERLSVG